MLGEGKTARWLRLPLEVFVPWAELNGVVFARTVPGTVAGRGGALLAKAGTNLDGSNVLLTVPSDLILSVERVKEHSKVDRDFREVLESLGDFGQTPRGAILTFLLVQASISCPDLHGHVGVHSPFTDYVKSLPIELLPTFWTQSELQLLTGTTLAAAISAKLKSVHREYDLLCESAGRTRWYQAVQNHLDFDDWLQVDSMYRSRALDFPGIGHCMVPCIDIANHASGEATIAVYERDTDGNAVLLLRDEKQVGESDEVTITYGDEKGACEMLFSYGFLEDHMDSAGALFLSLNIPDSDKFQAPKMSIADCAPGFKIIDLGEGETEWTGDFIWLLCVNEGDDFRFELARTVDGEVEMHAFFGEQELTGGAAELHSILRKSELWDIYQLRAVAILQQRVFDQMQALYVTQAGFEVVPHGERTDIRERPYKLAMELRRLEFALMEKAYEAFESQKLTLAESSVVIRYLTEMSSEPRPSSNSSNGPREDGEEDQEDFS